jgi:glycosyltransferase involved in cell wall biosynthesis
MKLAPVAIFAHNEERSIRSAIESVFAAFAGQQEFRPVVYVLENGSKDGTAAAAREVAAGRSDIHVVEIPFGDKADTWNRYVFELAPEAEAHIFMDGDVCMGSGAGPELLRVLASSPDALAAVALPKGGRHARQYAAIIRANPSIWGNLYALKKQAVEMFRKLDARLPVGHIGEDGLIGLLVNKDLDPRAPQKRERTVAATRATFDYTPMQDFWKYFRRRVNYSVRFYQFQFLGPRILAGGIQAMPRHIADLYEDMDTYRRPLRIGPNLLFDHLAWRRMKRAREARKAAVAGNGAAPKR